MGVDVTTRTLSRDSCDLDIVGCYPASRSTPTQHFTKFSPSNSEHLWLMIFFALMLPQILYQCAIVIRRYCDLEFKALYCDT
jgi:hypothetical protein